MIHASGASGQAVGALAGAEGAAAPLASAAAFAALRLPAPRHAGLARRGQALLEGRIVLAGRAFDLPATAWADTGPWAGARALLGSDPRVQAAVHGFGWLDDLAALGTAPARQLARRWVFGWMAAHGGGVGRGRGRGPAWAPEVAARRLMRWLGNGRFLLTDASLEARAAQRAALARQAAALGRRWRGAPAGSPARAEALAALVQAGVALGWDARPLQRTTRALGQAAQAAIGPDGGLASRNPEALLALFSALSATAEMQAMAGHGADPEHLAALGRAAAVLRALRHTDGRLPRFHGGAAAPRAALDQALAQLPGPRHRARLARGARAMGYLRLRAGRSSVIVDAAAPPGGAASTEGHASTLGLEFTACGVPLVASCGPGLGLADQAFARAARASAFHSTLALEGYSSSRIGQPGWWRRRRNGPDAAELAERPETVELAGPDADLRGLSATLWHDGYEASHGLTHVRRLCLAPDGRRLEGEDGLGAASDEARAIFATRCAEDPAGVAYAVHFHLHPAVSAEVEAGGGAARLTLPGRARWRFEHDGQATLALAPSVWLDPADVAPVSTLQLVLRTRVRDYARQLCWSFTRMADAPDPFSPLSARPSRSSPPSR